MINLKEFKQAVLQRAMQGKLTKQLSSDGNAKDLLVKIANRKRDLVQAGKLKGHSKPLPPVTSKEIPFKIPDDWEWTRLGNLVNVLEVPTIPKYKYKNSGIPFYRIKDVVIASRGLKPNITAYINKKDYFKGIKNKGPVSVNDLLITATGTLGISCIIKSNKPMYFQGSNNILWIKNSYKFNAHFLNMFFQSQLFYIQINNSSEGSTIKHLSIHLLSDLPIPLPPLTEQQRIVSKVHKCFLLANTIQKERDLHHKFAHDMKQSLLLDAMKGHLTQQLPSDGNAKHQIKYIFRSKIQLAKEYKIRNYNKHLNLIPANNIPYKLPHNWIWVTLDDVCELLNGRAYRQREMLSDNSLTPILRVGNLYTDKKWYYSNLKLAKKYYAFNDDLLYSWSASFGPKIWKGPKVIFHYHIWKILVSKKYIDEDYMYYVLDSITRLAKYESHGTSMKHITKTKMNNILIPLPPLSEQHRIVFKLHDLFNTINA